MESSGEGFDQHGSADGALRDTDIALGEGENIVPETSFLVVLHLGEVKVRTGSSFDELSSVVEEVEGKVEDGARDRGVVDSHPRFVEMPSSRTEG